MTEWVPVGGDFIKADVIRWKEGVFERRGPRGRRAINIGSRLVIAEVLTEPDSEGWALLLVIGFEVVSEAPGKRLVPIKKGTKTKRKLKTLVRGRAERLPWSDESARSMLASRFLGNRKPVSDMSDEEDIYES